MEFPSVADAEDALKSHGFEDIGSIIPVHKVLTYNPPYPPYVAIDANEEYFQKVWSAFAP
jgi:hypothetical protein